MKRFLKSLISPKRMISFVLALAMLCGMIPNIILGANAAEDYRAWAQGDSRWGYLPLGASSATVANSGCLATATTKLIIQAGLRDASSFDVGSFILWMNSNSGFTASGYMYWGAPAAFGLTNYGDILSYGEYSSSAYNNQLLSWINAGYHLILGVNYNGHYVAVDEARSLSTGQIYIMDSLSNTANADVVLTSRYPTFNSVHAYKGGSTATQTVWQPGKPAFTNMKTTYTPSEAITFNWNPTENTTHYNFWLYQKNSKGEWAEYEHTFYVESGFEKTLPLGEYRCLVQSVNSNYYSDNGTDWLYTESDYHYFNVEKNTKVITYYNAAGAVMKTEERETGASHKLSTVYPKLSGSYFSGWAYEKNADTYDVRPGETIQVNEDISLYPVYVSHSQAISGKPVLIYNIADFTSSGYKVQQVNTTISEKVDSSYWTEWSDYTFEEVKPSSTVEVVTETLYRYYYFLCPYCGGREPFYGTSDCGRNIPFEAGHVGWFPVPYSQCDYKTYSYTRNKYYTTSLGDGEIWNFSAGNLYDTVPGTVDASGVDTVVATSYSYRTYVKRESTVNKTVKAYKITKAASAIGLKFSLAATNYTYNGQVKTPGVTVKDSAGKTLKKNTDYTVTYAGGRRDVGTYKVTIKGKGDYSFTKTLTFKINPVNIDKCSVKLSATSYTYDGKIKAPTVTVKSPGGTTLTRGTSYTLRYEEGRRNAGTYTIKVTMKGNYTGTKTLSFKINPVKIEKCSVKLSATSYTYDGKMKAPTVTVKSPGGATLTRGTSYTLRYEEGRRNAGTYTVKVTMKGNYTGTKTLSFKINPVKIEDCSVKLSATSYTYDGKMKAPTVTVKSPTGATLTRGTSYTLRYEAGRRKVGTYTIKVTMKGNYTGTKTLTFKIVPEAPGVKKLVAKTKALTVQLDKQTTQTTGYQIQYATNKNFTSAKTTTVTNSTTTKTLSGLKAKTTYYVRVRAYKTVNGAKIYSGWSAAKYLKTK